MDIVDDFTNKKLTITSNIELDMHAYILKTISQSEKGFDMVSQQISFILSTEFAQNLELSLDIEVTDV